MDGRGSLRQLHQQLAGSTSYQPAPYGYAPEWQSGCSEKRPPPPLPTLPPWALDPLTSATQFQQQREAARLSSSSSGAREEHDPASMGGRRSDQEIEGWRKALSYFGTVKRLPLPTNGTIDPTTNQVSQRQPSSGSFTSCKRQHNDEERAQQIVSLPVAEPFNQQYFPQKQNQQQETDEEPERVGVISESFSSQNGKRSHDALEDDPCCGDGVRDKTDQVEDEEQHHDHSDQLHAKPSIPVLQQGGFFRPWKKTGRSEDEMRDNNYLSDREGEADSP